MSETTPLEPEILETSPEVKSEIASETTSENRPPRNDRKNDRPRGGRRDNLREEPKEFQEELLGIDRVTRVTAGGRQLRFRASIVIGDGKGRVGLGMGKSGEVQGAIEKAIRDAKKNLITFPIVSGTIPHDVTYKFKTSSIFLHPAHSGTGIIAGGAVRKVFAVSGIKDVIAKQHGAPNKITNARVVILALQALKPVDQMKNFSRKPAPSPALQADSENSLHEVTTEKEVKRSAAKKSVSPKKKPTKA